MTLIPHPDGRPVSERYISDRMPDLSRAIRLPKVVFHSLRSTSASVKLILTGGDIKTVQADTGQANAKVLMDIYARSFAANQIEMA